MRTISDTERKRDYWGICGLLHDIDFEMYPEEHCKKAPELLAPSGVGEDMIRTVCSHGYGICSDIEPEHEMEKVLFAADELTGLIWAGGSHASVKKCLRYGSFQCEEKVQGQTVCRRMFERYYPHRGGAAWMGAEHAL